MNAFFPQEKEKRNAMAATWSAVVWNFIHTSALYLDQLSVDKKPLLAECLLALDDVIPCASCKNTINQFQDMVNIQDYMTNSQTLFQWTVDLHNYVNTKLGKPTATADAVQSLWCKETEICLQGVYAKDAIFSVIWALILGTFTYFTGYQDRALDDVLHAILNVYRKAMTCFMPMDLAEMFENHVNMVVCLADATYGKVYSNLSQCRATMEQYIKTTERFHLLYTPYLNASAQTPAASNVGIYAWNSDLSVNTDQIGSSNAATNVLDLPVVPLSPSAVPPSVEDLQNKRSVIMQDCTNMLDGVHVPALSSLLQAHALANLHLQVYLLMTHSPDPVSWVVDPAIPLGGCLAHAPHVYVLKPGQGLVAAQEFIADVNTLYVDVNLIFKEHTVVEAKSKCMAFLNTLSLIKEARVELSVIYYPQTVDTSTLLTYHQ